jgi:pyruvate formate lyase activating enzyme
MIADYGSSFLDYEGKIAMIIFTQGCNYNCWYCSNSSLKKLIREPTRVSETIEHLRNNLDYYQAIVITGGEPTIWKDRLENFLENIHSFGLPIKLDTNGSHPKVLERLLNKGLLAVIAMDIKHDIFNFEKMEETIGKKYGAKEWEALTDSIAIVSRYSNVKKIYRTTLIPTLNPVKFVKIARMLEAFWDDNSVYHLQRYDHTIAETPIIGEEPNLEAYMKILNSFGFNYKLKNF